jgi:hypothetical protein
LNPHPTRRAGLSSAYHDSFCDENRISRFSNGDTSPFRVFFVCRRTAIGQDDEERFLDPRRRGAPRCVATRHDAREGIETRAKGVFPPCACSRSMGSPWRQTSPYLYCPRYFPMKPLGSAPCRSRGLATVPNPSRSPLLPAEGRRIELGRICRGIHPQ